MKPRVKTSIVWITPLDEFTKMVKESKSIKEILTKLGLKNKGGNPRTLKTRIKHENLDVSHIQHGSKFVSRTGRILKSRIPLLQILIENSTYSRHALKRRLIKENIIEYKCKECGIGPEWNNKKLSLQLDHVNGISNDNRIENLRFLCPNCHSQTECFAGKNKKY